MTLITFTENWSQPLTLKKDNVRRGVMMPNRDGGTMASSPD